MDEFTRGAAVALAAVAIFAPLWWESRRQARWRRHMSTVPGLLMERRTHPSRLPALCVHCQATVPDLRTHYRLAHTPRVVGAEDRADWRTR